MTIRQNKNMNLADKIREAFKPYKLEVKRRASGYIPHDYLVPSGPYNEQWDWDAFFIGIALADDIPSEAIYLKNWVLNYLAHTNKKTGFTPGLLTSQGRDKRLHHIKPFLAQGAYYASRFLDDYQWLRLQWSLLKKSITYRERNLWNDKYNLGCWHDSMESGADNNVAVLGYEKGTVAGADLNAFLYQEYKAMSFLAGHLNKKKDKKIYKKKSSDLKKSINKYLWDPEDKTYYNLDTKNHSLIKRMTHSNVIPLWAKIASPREGQTMIKKYLINSHKLWGKYGIRSLAKDDPDYNNRRIIKPHSNWQGPVWPIANFFYLGALLNYSFYREADLLVQKIAKLCLADIKRTGGMHENYNAENGKALAAPNFISWNLLIETMIAQSSKKESDYCL